MNNHWRYGNKTGVLLPYHSFCWILTPLAPLEWGSVCNSILPQPNQATCRVCFPACGCDCWTLKSTLYRSPCMDGCYNNNLLYTCSEGEREDIAAMRVRLSGLCHQHRELVQQSLAIGANTRALMQGWKAQTSRMEDRDDWSWCHWRASLRMTERVENKE